MAQVLQTLVDQKVEIVTVDGRVFVGTLKGFDQSTNLILDKCEERIYSLDAAVEQIALGLYLIRGDNIAVVGEVDVEVDESIQLSSVRAAPLKPKKERLYVNLLIGALLSSQLQTM
ncbi:U6 snRNA-associated protein LSm8-like protein,related [Neospora caninum Liverpool]|uniref:U6 snRNA-associated Sm-like protein LSm8 n=1 Tax=Neospora caninum (strain Liverpool) TaxID=572307 RepID=F0VIX5_NEOCL|nr:U6 snRNA-associated protein LSm8-like protein,related [Neospora caninum Liverpool]CBZ53686.1 U6 snRNA-associated protein LSm8-like protein,related [Neospora caninum Liverpool]|eukprot:XP_003883718.1 U6 snRNA-associated protein LSm8-like protein,related [Neospora caninum Liverpool]